MGMKITENNVRAAAEILKVLAENKCHIDDVYGIFRYVEDKLRREMTVPELDYDALLGELMASLDE